MAEPSLHVTAVRAANSDPSQALLFLHGILGSGANLRGLAQAIVQAHPYYVALLVDLRLHGRSRSFVPPHDVHACAADLERLETTVAQPIVGDVRYGKGDHNRLFRERFGFHRLALHCHEITFDHPRGAQPVRLRAPLSPDFAGLLEAIGLSGASIA